MVHGYRSLQYWNQWLAQHFLGCHLFDVEKENIKPLLSRHLGKHALLIGVPNQYLLFNSTSVPCHSLVSPLICKEKLSGYIEGDLQELPLLTGSIDLVFLPHTLEYVDNPRQLLAEATRVIKPEGLIVIVGFNPYSTWGLKRLLTQHKTAPWGANFIHAHKIRSWLQLADFEMEQDKTILFSPPLTNPDWFKKMRFLEWIGTNFFPIFGGVYILIARAKVVPLTPIRLQWKQQLSGIPVSTTISGHTARQTR